MIQPGRVRSASACGGNSESIKSFLVEQGGMTRQLSRGVLQIAGGRSGGHWVAAMVQMEDGVDRSRSDDMALTGIAQMQKGRVEDVESLESMRRVVRMYGVVGVVFCTCVVVATVLLWDNLGFGDSASTEGYAVHSPSHRADTAHRSRRSKQGVASSHLISRRPVVSGGSNQLVWRQRHLEELRMRAKDLAQRVVIAEVADKYAPASFLAAHRRPEHAAILEIASSRAAFERAVRQVEAGLREREGRLDVQDKGTDMGSILHAMAAAATRAAMHNLAQHADSPWVDHGLDERKSAGWIRDEIKAMRGKHAAALQSRRTRSSGIKAGGMSLPGLGSELSPLQAAKALQRLATKAAGARSGQSGANERRASDGNRPRDDLHAALTRHNALQPHTDIDLHRALQRQEKVQGELSNAGQARWMHAGQRADAQRERFHSSLTSALPYEYPFSA